MIRRRKIGSMAVLGGLAAAYLLLAPVPGTADELSDLRDNQQNLQQRIDKLATPATPAPTAPNADGAPPTLGQPLAGSSSFPRSFLIPGTNTSVRIGGTIDATGAYGISK